MKLWGGNYSRDPDETFWELNRSFPFDRRLLAEEVRASSAYVQALARCQAITADEASRLTEAHDHILERAAADPGYLDVDVEDVHSFVETRLTEALGELAGQAHLSRSRNEQTVVALRMWIRSRIDEQRAALVALIEALVKQGRAGADAVMPGYTHTRPAEPITFGHLAAAHAWALLRDRGRLSDARARVDVLPLGSGALAGTALSLDRESLARDLGFAAVSDNALDAVTDRDFALEFVVACAQVQTHLSRLAEDLMRLSAPESGFITLPEAFTTGSSLMPQKQNPDALELIRGKAARVGGDVSRLLTLLQGLPSGYQKDLQEDKEAVFDAADTVAASLAVMTGVVAGVGLHRQAMREAASGEEMMAAGLAVALALDGCPFRQAHTRVGALVARSRQTGLPLRQTAAGELAEEFPAVVARLEALFDPEQVVRTRAARGGTAPAAVEASLAAVLAAVNPSF